MARFEKNLKGSEAPSAELSKRATGSWLIKGGLLLLVVSIGGFGAVKVLRGSSSPSATVLPTSSAEVVAGIEKQSGPWGDLEISDIQIDPPDEYAAKLYVPASHGVWFFGAGYDRSRILGLFRSADLTESQRAELEDSARWETTAQGILITPEPQTVFKLSRAARSRIYRALAEFPENFFQSSPFMFSKKRADDWFFHSGLAAETVALVSGLLYEHGGMLCFSDVGILTHVSSDAEKTRLIMALSRTPTVLANLRIAPGSNPDGILRYWCRQGDEAGARQLINSVARERNGGSIDITHLLPPFVREHVYTYPRIPGDRTIKGPDCFWSALSFEQEPPDYKLVNEPYLVERLKEDYESTREQPQRGDILVFSNDAGRIVHSCVYIAGNIVFTKNGTSVFAPWVLMRIQDVTGIYSGDTPSKIICFRKKMSKGS